MINASPLLGTALHFVGAASSSVCYAPQKKVRGWSWQSYWLTQAAFCWFLLPILGALLTIPHLSQVLAQASKPAMIAAFVLGMAYGVGGTAFGISIRYIGFSLTYAIAVGVSSVLGTLMTPLIKPELAKLLGWLEGLLGTSAGKSAVDAMAKQATLGELLHKTGAGWVLAGIVIGTAGIALCGIAGRLKEVDIQGQSEQSEFSLVKGLLLSLLAGVLSAVYGFSLEAGDSIADVATELGAGAYRGNVVYIFSNTGAFLTTGLYCLYLHLRHKTLGELIELPAGQEGASLPMNFAMAALTGFLWYMQFFFYNLGHVRMGEYKFTSWALHMIMLVLISNVIAILFREWRGCRPATRWTIGLGLAVLVAAILALGYGNHLGSQVTAKS